MKVCVYVYVYVYVDVQEVQMDYGRTAFITAKQTDINTKKQPHTLTN